MARLKKSDIRKVIVSQVKEAYTVITDGQYIEYRNRIPKCVTEFLKDAHEIDRCTVYYKDDSFVLYIVYGKESK